MLDSVDLKVRLSKATELVDRHLQVRTLSSFFGASKKREYNWIGILELGYFLLLLSVYYPWI